MRANVVQRGRRGTFSTLQGVRRGWGRHARQCRKAWQAWHVLVTSRERWRYARQCRQAWQAWPSLDARAGPQGVGALCAQPPQSVAGVAPSRQHRGSAGDGGAMRANVAKHGRRCTSSTPQAGRRCLQEAQKPQGSPRSPKEGLKVGPKRASCATLEETKCSTTLSSRLLGDSCALSFSTLCPPSSLQASRSSLLSPHSSSILSPGPSLRPHRSHSNKPRDSRDAECEIRAPHHHFSLSAAGLPSHATSCRCRGRSPRVSPSLTSIAGIRACQKGLVIKCL